MGSPERFHKSKHRLSEKKQARKGSRKRHEDEEESGSESQWSSSTSESEASNGKMKGLVTVVKTEKRESPSNSSSNAESESNSDKDIHARHSKSSKRGHDSPDRKKRREDDEIYPRKHEQADAEKDQNVHETRRHKHQWQGSRKVQQQEKGSYSRGSDHHSYDTRKNRRPYSDQEDSHVQNRHQRRKEEYRSSRHREGCGRDIPDRHHRSQSSDRGDRYKRGPDYREERSKRDRQDVHEGRRRNGSGPKNRDRNEYQRPQRERSKEKQSNAESESENWASSAATKKEEPNFGLSGKLTEFTNTYNGVVIKYNEPPEARKPRTRWRLYPFKGEETLAMLHIHRQSAYLFGRDRKIADIPVDHPSCSKQHSVLQFRLVDYERPDGIMGKRVKPYIIDLESTNGTYVNNKRIDPRRYVELIEKDVLKFGFSTREYVILHEKSKDDESDEETAETG